MFFNDSQSLKAEDKFVQLFKDVGNEILLKFVHPKKAGLRLVIPVASEGIAISNRFGHC
jgi:hypothetical protein